MAIGPADVDLKEGSATIVYTVGSATDRTLRLVIQTIADLNSAPSGVPAATGGLADQGIPAWLVLMVGLGLLVAAGGAVRLATNRQ